MLPTPNHKGDDTFLCHARWCAMATLIAAAPVSSGQDVPAEKEAPPDKWGYTLFGPTPRELMRPMSTDRPDQTESPYTVDAGHFQVEMHHVNALFDHDQSGDGDVRTIDYGLAVLNLKAGLLNNV